MAGAGGSGSGGVVRDVDALEGVRSIVLKPSESLDESRFTRIAGADFNDPGLGPEGLLASLASTGFQASNLGDAIDVVNQMLDWRLSHEKPSEDCDEAELEPKYRESVKCKIFLGFTSNLVSSGIRDIIRFLAQHHMVDVIVTSAGGIEEDLIKCLAPTYRGDFSLPGTLLRSKGLNRIGNLLVPNDNYCKFENWIMPLFDQMLLEQSTEVKYGEGSSSSKEGLVTLQYPLLTGSNYTAWAIKMKAYLKAQGVWETIDSEKEVDEHKDQMALAAIYQGIPEETLLLIAEKETAKEAWKMLKTMHMGVERVMEAKVQTLKIEFDALRMKDGESIDAFAMKLTSIVSKIRALGEKMEEPYVVKKLLRVVPKRFLQVVSTIEQFGDFKIMTVEEVIRRLKAYEERISIYADGEGEHLLLPRDEWRAKEEKASGRSRKFDKKKVKCFKCKNFGHYSYDCPLEKKEGKACITEKQEDVLLMAEACLL